MMITKNGVEKEEKGEHFPNNVPPFLFPKVVQ
jgi:hypothetical protein